MKAYNTNTVKASRLNLLSNVLQIDTKTDLATENLKPLIKANESLQYYHKLWHNVLPVSTTENIYHHIIEQTDSLEIACFKDFPSG